MEVNQASALLHRLVGRGAVVEESQGRKVRYRLAERMYNIYHLLRRRGAGAARVRAVIDFMVHLYEGEGLVGAVGTIAEEAMHLAPEARRDHFNVIEGILLSVGDWELRERLLDTVPEVDVITLPDTPESLQTTWLRLTRKSIRRLAGETKLLRRETELLKEVDEFDREFTESMKAGHGKLMKKERYAEAGAALEQLMRIRPKDIEYIGRAVSVYSLGGYHIEAERCLRERIATDPGDADVLLLYLPMWHGLQPEEKERLLGEYEHEAASGHAWAWVALACLWSAEEKRDAVVRAFQEALRLNAENPLASMLALFSLCRCSSQAEINRWTAIHREYIGRGAAWVASLLESDPSAIVRSHRAVMLAMADRWQEAWPVVDKLLSSEGDSREVASQIWEFFLEAATAGHVSKSLEVLHASPTQILFEPIIVALRQLSGQPVQAPQEVQEIAADLLLQVASRRKDRERTPMNREIAPEEQPSAHSKSSKNTVKRSVRAAVARDRHVSRKKSA